MKVLIAEDDISSLGILKTVLTQWEFEVLPVSNGKEAMEMLLEDNGPKLALLDWIMPDRDGIEVCRQVRQKQTANPPYIILLTSRGDKNDITRGLDSGANDYIVKPYDRDELKSRLHVGKRMIVLQSALAEKEKFQGVVEMAGAVCHEFNQPLMAISGYSELLLMDLSPDHPHYDTLEKIVGQVNRLGKITKKLMNVTQYKTKSYLESSIVDIVGASQKKS